MSYLREQYRKKRALENMQSISEADIAKWYVKKGIDPDSIPTVRDVIKGALYSGSQGEGSKLSRLAFSMAAVSSAGTAAMKNAVVRQGISDLRKALIAVSNPKRHQKLRINDGKRRSVQKSVDYIFSFSKTGTECAYCGSQFEDSKGLKQHIREDHLNNEETFKSSVPEVVDLDSQSQKRHDTDNSGAYSRINQLNAINRQIGSYLANEREAEHRRKRGNAMDSFKPEVSSYKDVSTGASFQRGVTIPSQQRGKNRPIGEQQAEERDQE